MGSSRLLLALGVLLAAVYGCYGDAAGPQQAAAAQGTQATGGAAAAAAAHPPPAKKHPKLRQKGCPPDNARCIALRDHVCDPYFANVTDV